MKLQPVKLLLIALSRVPGAIGESARIVLKADVAIDKAADQARKRRAKLVEEIRSRSTVLAIMLALLWGSGCATARMLKSEGHRLTWVDRVRLCIYDTLTGVDNGVDAVIDLEMGDGE